MDYRVDQLFMSRIRESTGSPTAEDRQRVLEEACSWIHNNYPIVERILPEYFQDGYTCLATVYLKRGKSNLNLVFSSPFDRIQERIEKIVKEIQDMIPYE